MQWTNFSDIVKEPAKSEGLRYAQHQLPWLEGGQLARRHLLQPSPAAVGNPEQSKRGREVLCQTKLWENPTAAWNTSLPKIWISSLNKWTYRTLQFHILKKKKKKKCKQDECFWLKDQNHSPVTGEEFFPQDVPDEKSLSSLLVASYTPSHTARTTLCTRLSPGEIQLQN